MTRLGSRFVNEGWVQETPSGSVNGSNAAFTLAFTPDDSAGVRVYVNGLIQKPTTHYTISSTTITFVTAPAVGQDLLVEYTKSL